MSKLNELVSDLLCGLDPDELDKQASWQQARDHQHLQNLSQYIQSEHRKDGLIIAKCFNGDFEQASPKALDQIEDKARKKYNNNINGISDVCRGAEYCKDLDKLENNLYRRGRGSFYEALETLANNGRRIIQISDRLALPKPTGLMNIEIKLGHQVRGVWITTEHQIRLDCLRDAYDSTHHKYKIIKTINEKFGEIDTPPNYQIKKDKLFQECENDFQTIATQYQLHERFFKYRSPEEVEKYTARLAEKAKKQQETITREQNFTKAYLG